MSLKKVLLIVSGGIAAYKAPEIVSKLREKSVDVQCILTKGGAEFITPLTLQTISGKEVYSELFSLNSENEIGHIQLSRSVDVILIAPASANIISNIAHGLTPDLATTTLLATNKPVTIVPAMNPLMWENPATKDNIKILKSRGISILGPSRGKTACGEFGDGRMLEPLEIVEALERSYDKKGPLSGLRTLVTSGPTYESIDAIRFIGNRSSGKQGHNIAQAISKLGSETTLVSGPTQQPCPESVNIIRVESAEDMLNACKSVLPTDIAICTAAVADWKVLNKSPIKLKKSAQKVPPEIQLTENPDILKFISQKKIGRPRLVIGFAAETNDIVQNAIAKRTLKGCDWIIANDVSLKTETIGGDENKIHLISEDGVDAWPLMSKYEVSIKLARLISHHFKDLK